MFSEFIIIFTSLKLITYLYIGDLKFTNNFYLFISSILGILIYFITSHYKVKTSYLNEFFAYQIFQETFL